MIDVDRFEEQLDLALTDELRGALGLATATRPAPQAPPAQPIPVRRDRRPTLSAAVPRPRPVANPAPAAKREHPAGTARNDIAALMQAGLTDEADALIATRRAAAEASGNPDERREVAGWETMQALVHGRVHDARENARKVLSLGQQAGREDAQDRYWAQQYWIVLDWGDERERYQLLDECRERAYGRNDLYWRAALALLCARMGRNDEAAREFDASVTQLDSGRGAHSPETLAVVTNLVEAASVIGDPARVRTVQRALAAASDALVVDGRAQVCKGALVRYRAHASAASWKWEESDRAFEEAVDTHRAMGALPLLARTLYEWGLTLTSRGDPQAWDRLTESTDLARRLHMTGAISATP